MAGSLTQLVLNVGSITSLGLEDLNGDSATPRMRPGSISIIVDAYGPRIVQYCKFINAMAVAELASKPANVSVSNITSGSTTGFVTSGLTADVHNGKLAYVLDNDDSSGAAPEGEVGIIAKNTATIVTLEKDYPLSVALAANDDLSLISNWQAEDAADGDLAVDVLGVVLATGGVSAGSYGWVQREGYCLPLYSTNAITAANPVVAGANVLDAFGSDGQELHCGVSLAAITSDQAAFRVPTNLKLFTCAGVATAP